MTSRTTTRNLPAGWCSVSPASSSTWMTLRPSSKFALPCANRVGGVEIVAVEVPDAWLCTPRQYPDDRGLFLEWFRGDLLAAKAGRRFDVVQANHSISRRGSVRGLHFTDVPAGQAKYVYCARGA